MTHKKKLSGKVRWFTPPDILQQARIALGGGFTLDPASERHANDLLVGACRYLTEEDNALETDWGCGVEDRVWCNPPYARGVIGPFADRFIEQLGEAAGAILVNSDTGTVWYQRLLEACSYAVLFRQRLKFYCPDEQRYVAGNAMASTLFVFNGRGPWQGWNKLGVVITAAKN